MSVSVLEQAIVEADPVFANSDNMFMSRPERYRHGLRKACRFTALKAELKLRCLEHGGLVGKGLRYCSTAGSASRASR